MALPSITAPEYTLTLPSNKKKVKYRPFLVKEEKLLLFAAESGEREEMMSAVAQMIDNCVLDDIDSRKLPYFDFEHLFLHIRAKSVGETSTFIVKHDKEGCGHQNEVTVQLDKIIHQTDKDHKSSFQLTDKIGIKMKYPTIESIKTFIEIENDPTKILNMFTESIECVYDEDEVYDDFTKEEAVEFLESLSKEQFDKVALFFQNMPSSKIEVKYKCEGCGENVKTTVSGFEDFFS